LLLILGSHRRHRVIRDLTRHSSASELGAQRSPTQASLAVRGVDRQLGEGGIVDQSHVAQTVEHRLADLLGNPPPAQCLG